MADTCGEPLSCDDANLGAETIERASYVRLPDGPEGELRFAKRLVVSCDETEGGGGSFALAPIRITQTDAENSVDGSGTITPVAGREIQITDNGRVYIADGIRTIAVIVAEENYLVPNSGIRRYVAKVTQNGTDDPVATVLENALGAAVVWTRNNMGDYVATLVGAFPQARTVIYQPRMDLLNNLTFIQVNNPADDFFQVQTYDMSGFPDTQAPADNILNGTDFIVTVYPAA